MSLTCAYCLCVCVCTDVWTSMALCSLIKVMISRGYTGFSFSISVMAVSMVINTPVRPMPALQKNILLVKWAPDKICVSVCWKSFHLQWTMRGTDSSLILLVDWRKSRKSEESSGTPWSGQAAYCKWVIERCCPNWKKRKGNKERERGWGWVRENAWMSMYKNKQV